MGRLRIDCPPTYRLIRVCASGSSLDAGVDWPLLAHPLANGLHISSGACRCCDVSLLHPPPVEEQIMSDSTAHRSTDHRDSRTIAEIVAETPPMDDLKQFLIEDLTPDEEAEFYRVLEEA